MLWGQKPVATIFAPSFCLTLDHQYLLERSFHPCLAPWFLQLQPREHLQVFPAQVANGSYAQEFPRMVTNGKRVKWLPFPPQNKRQQTEMPCLSMKETLFAVAREAGF